MIFGRHGIRLALVLLFAHAATAADAPVPPPAPIVFVPGIKGSTLTDARGEVQWLTGAEALGLRTPNLSLPLTWDGTRQVADGMQPQGVLERVRILPFGSGTQVYAPWLRAAESWGTPFYPFAYDWRRDNLETLDRLEAFVDSVRQRHGGARVRIVGHSLGGLLSWALLRRRPDLIERAVFAGVPFDGGIGFLLDQHAGTSTGLNSAILSPRIMFTFPSAYALLPLPGGDEPKLSKLVDDTGAAMPADFFDAAEWVRLKLGIFGYPAAELPVGAREFLGKALARARAFREQISPLPSNAPAPRILVISGTGTPTLDRAVRGGPHSVRGWDFESAPKLSGDGRVAEIHSLPPSRGGATSPEAAGTFERLTTPAEHSALLNDPAVLERVRGFLR